MYEELLVLLKQLISQQNHMNNKIDKIVNKINSVNYKTTDLTKLSFDGDIVIDKNSLDYYGIGTSRNWNDIEL